MVKYLSAQEISDRWGITKRRVQDLCVSGRISGAVRIGNMWAIPDTAGKPQDARFRNVPAKDKVSGTIMRKARRQLRTLVENVIGGFKEEGYSSVDALRMLVVIFASELLHVYIENDNRCLSLTEEHFHYKMPTKVPDGIRKKAKEYIESNSACIDDSLSWVYQFGSKEGEEFEYKDTQFFTEKYMISTLVDSLDINLSSRIMDPACGGGNFLLYSFEKLVRLANGKTNIDKAKQALVCMRGYEIDRFLAYVAAFNLKLKVLSFVSESPSKADQLFCSLQPNIFFPVKGTVSGFLDREWSKHEVINSEDEVIHNLKDVFAGTNVVITNPPFRTIKGMPIEQKAYLQENYPLTKCDLCVAFIERIMQVLPSGGRAAMVTQNSWMYLDSFSLFRSNLLNKNTVSDIWELGSNAFYDLSGEKTNVTLVILSKESPQKDSSICLRMLRNMNIEEMEHAIERDVQSVRIKQEEVIKNCESRFDMVSTAHLRNLQTSCEPYKNFAIPMQGTSTGDAKKLIDYFWKHIGDEDWRLVSKGGGYSRFEGLNSYCVKWGKDGEYIKQTKGSAIRNASYFDNTQLVFSDTGTAGLNVRVLLPDQIFVASGPGIRLLSGNTMSHLAFLNSRFAAFYVRLISPKLTIAAGYIGQIPVTKEVLNSPELEKSAEACLRAKIHRLAKRPNNVEFTYIKHASVKIDDEAERWFREDLEDEWTQLINEQAIEETIAKEMELTSEDKTVIDEYIGERVVFKGDRDYSEKPLEKTEIVAVLGADCFPRRTKVNKQSLGSDGIIEHLSKLKGISCEEVFSLLRNHYEYFNEQYINLYMHALVVSAMKYREGEIKRLNIDALLSEMGVTEQKEIRFTQDWLENHFSIVHREIFEGQPMFEYNNATKEICRRIANIES